MTEHVGIVVVGGGSRRGASLGRDVVRFTALDQPAEIMSATNDDPPAEAAYDRHGGILPYILRQLLRADEAQQKVV